MTQEALKLALEALELHGKQYPHMVKGYCLDAINAIKKALAQPDGRSFAEVHPRNPDATCKCEHWQSCIDCHPTAHTEKYITDAMKVRQAVSEAVLQQPEQDPIGYLCENAVGHKYFRWKKPSGVYKPIALYAAPIQPEQEPVAWSYWQSCLNDDGTQTAPWVHRLSKFQPSESIINKDITPLYTTPPQRKPLTDEQAELLIENSDGRWCDGEFRIDGPDLMRLLKAAHGIKE